MEFIVKMIDVNKDGYILTNKQCANIIFTNRVSTCGEYKKVNIDSTFQNLPSDVLKKFDNIVKSLDSLSLLELEKDNIINYLNIIRNNEYYEFIPKNQYFKGSRYFIDKHGSVLKLMKAETYNNILSRNFSNNSFFISNKTNMFMFDDNTKYNCFKHSYINNYLSHDGKVCYNFMLEENSEVKSFELRKEYIKFIPIAIKNQDKADFLSSIVHDNLLYVGGGDKLAESNIDYNHFNYISWLHHLISGIDYNKSFILDAIYTKEHILNILKYYIIMLSTDFKITYTEVFNYHSEVIVFFIDDKEIKLIKKL